MREVLDGYTVNYNGNNTEKKPYEEYEDPTEEEFKEAAEQFITELVNDLYPNGFVEKDTCYSYLLIPAYTAARQARFERRGF